MIHKRGYWWPDTIRDKDVDFAINRLKHATAMVEFCKRRGVLIQAGGCCGLYPIEQAPHFSHVYTFEIEPSNWECMVSNIADYKLQKRITPCHAALSNLTGGVRYTKCNYSTHTVNPVGELFVLAGTIDYFCEGYDVTAIQLDVEGHELEVLQGARETIERKHPVIQVEELPDRDCGEVAAFLAERGYTRLPQKFGKDRLYVHA
jgi:FkbM family methyltransferase